MAKWNPFEDKVLNADPDEFAGSEDAGYGVPRDADSAESFVPDGSTSDSLTSDSPGMVRSDSPSPDDIQPADSEIPAAETAAESCVQQGTTESLDDSGAVPDDGSTNRSGSPNGFGTSPDGGSTNRSDSPQDAGDQSGFGAPQDTVNLNGSGTSPDTGNPNGSGTPQDAGGPAGPGSPQGPGGPGFGPGHDFEDDEPKFDTQTGEPLDKPKKKLPALLLTIAVTALAVGAFVYSVQPGALPSKQDKQTKQPVETETKLAIAAAESKSETEAASHGKAQTETLSAAAQTKEGQTESAAKKSAVVSAGAETESASKEEPAEEPAALAGGETESAAKKRTVISASAETESASKEEPAEKPAALAGAKAETEAADETETETETENETGTKSGTKTEDGPRFSTDGITVSAFLDVSDLAEEAMPEIVSVTCADLQTVRDFFSGKKEILQEDAGSGIIIDKDDGYLYIVTDAVFVRDAKDVTVGFSVKKDAADELKDEDTMSAAEGMGIDEESLLAVIRVPVSGIEDTVLSSVKTAVLGDSGKLRVGERVFAIGNAVGRGLSVTQGIVSALPRSMRYGLADHELIQTDAAINSGNYGGALLNEEGEVIGINSRRITEDFSEGMGFAYPAGDAKKAFSRILEEGASASEPETEADVETKKSGSKSEGKMPESSKETEKGTLSLALADESEDAKAGKDDQTVPETEQNKKEPKKDQPKETESAGQTLKDSGESEQGQLGIQVGEFSKEDQIIYRIPAGVVVASVADGSGAQAAGLAAGDLITGINDAKVESVEELKKALSGLKPGDKARVTFIRPDADSTYHGVKETNVTVTLG